MAVLRRLTPLRLRRRWLPHPRRLAAAPAVTGPALAHGEAEVALRGLVCAVCAARTAAAFRRVEGVETVHVDLARGTATLRFAPGAEASRERLQQALEGVVVAMPVRRAMERLAVAARRARGGMRR